MLVFTARYCGEPSQEKAFLAERKKKEAERANPLRAKAAAAASKAQKVWLVCSMRFSECGLEFGANGCQVGTFGEGRWEVA